MLEMPTMVQAIIFWTCRYVGVDVVINGSFARVVYKFIHVWALRWREANVCDKESCVK